MKFTLLNIIGIRGVQCTALVAILMTVDLTAQDTLSRWRFTANSSFYLPARAEKISGSDKMNFLPSCGWQFNVAYNLIPGREILLYYSRGATSYYTRNVVHGNSQIPGEWDSRFYILHPYNSIGIEKQIGLRKSRAIGLGIGNRFYVSSQANITVDVFDASTSVNHEIFNSRTNAPTTYFCPEFIINYSAPLFKRYPSWRYMVMITIVPISAIKGNYSFLPEYPNDTSYGTIRVRSSHLSVGFIYRRVRKID